MLEKVGFQLEGILKNNAFKNGQVLDMALYVITRQIGELRRFRKGDEYAVSDVICTTLAVSNQKDYSPAFIEENI